MTSKHRTQPTCQTCSQPVTDNAYLCHTCGDRIAQQLGDIPALLDDLTVTYTRTGAGDVETGETGLPWSEAASDALATLTNELVSWVRLLIDDHGGQWPHDTPAAESRWLLARVDWIRRHPAAADCYTNLRDAISEINYVMDLRAERWYAGPCRAEYVTDPDADDGTGTNDACCLLELYVKPGADLHVCRHCSTPHDITARREWLLRQAEDTLAHAELIGRALASMGEAVTPDAVRGYALRGRIVQHGVDRKGRPTYRVGDVVEVVRQIAVEKSKRDAKRAAQQERRRERSCA